MYKERVLISDHKQSERILERIAWQILESYAGKSLPLFLGIGERGFSLATILAQETGKLAQQAIRVQRLPSWRQLPQDENYPSLKPDTWRSQNLLLIDDVLYSGKTMYKALELVMQVAPQEVKSMVWIDRGHRCFPVTADFIGIQLATVLQDFVEVKISVTEYQIETFLR